MNIVDVYEVTRICRETLSSNTLPKITTNFFTRWFDKYSSNTFYTFNTLYARTYTIITANDIARYYTLKWLSEQNEIPVQQAVHTAWYICREVTMYLGPLILLNQRSIFDDQLEKRLKEDYSEMAISDDVEINMLISVTKSIVRSTVRDHAMIACNRVSNSTRFKKTIHDEECRMDL